MKKYAVTIAWSQTCHESILVHANDPKHAEILTLENSPGINHIVRVIELVNEINAKPTNKGAKND